MGSVCTCSRCKEWDLQQDPVRAVHNFYSDTNPGVSEACDTNKTTPSCVCQPGSKVYYRECVCVSQQFSYYRNFAVATALHHTPPGRFGEERKVGFIKNTAMRHW